MDENAVITLIAMETIAPKRKVTRSAGAIYIILIVLIIGCMSAGNLLYDLLGIPRYVTQPILYAGIAFAGYFIYRRNYLRYRYTLTDDMLALEQIGGSEERTIAAIDLAHINNIHQNKLKQKNAGKAVYANLPPRKNITWVLVSEDGKETRYAISASDEFIGKLNEQWQQVKQANDIHTVELDELNMERT